jgi:MOSC domain-containing protein YiiM
MQQAIVVSVNRSEKKGTIKLPFPFIILDNKGVSNDAHAGDWHRQVSLLAIESITRFEKKLGREIACGEFAENITTQAIELHTIPIGAQLSIGEVVIEVTQIGKKCHGTGCEIFNQVGDCVMPKEGIFCKVVKGGVVKPNDIIRILNY